MTKIVETKNTGSIVIPVVIPCIDLWSNVMGSGWEYMGWWSSVDYLEGSDWDIVGSFDITANNPDDSTEPEQTKRFNIDDLARGYALAIQNNFRHCGSHIDLYDMDACSSDAVLQYAFFGELIYG